MKYPLAAVPILFVATPSPQADRIDATLRSFGLSVTRADNICLAELYAEAQQFAGAVYDQSLSEVEQVSLARVMRLRWPWMRIIRWVAPGNSLSDNTLFDCSALSESQLADCVERSLTG